MKILKTVPVVIIREIKLVQFLIKCSSVLIRGHTKLEAIQEHLQNQYYLV